MTSDGKETQIGIIPGGNTVRLWQTKSLKNKTNKTFVIMLKMLPQGETENCISYICTRSDILSVFKTLKRAYVTYTEQQTLWHKWKPS